MTRLIIARHGNTFGPGEPPRRVGARSDLDLVASGIEQAFQLGTYLKNKQLIPDRIIAGPLKRTKQMADIAGRMISKTPAPIEIDARLREIDYGPDEGLPEDQVIARIGEKALKDWEEQAIVPDGWRADPDQMIQDWQDIADQIARDNAGQTVLIVTSNGIARFAPYITGDFEAFKAEFPLKLSTGAIGVIDQPKGENWQIRCWNVKPSQHI